MTSGGERRDLEVLIEPIGEGEGVVACLLAMGTDVTEARRRERARESDQARGDRTLSAADITSWRLAVAVGPFAADPSSADARALIPADATDARFDDCRERVHSGRSRRPTAILFARRPPSRRAPEPS